MQTFQSHLCTEELLRWSCQFIVVPSCGQIWVTSFLNVALLGFRSCVFGADRLHVSDDRKTRPMDIKVQFTDLMMGHIVLKALAQRPKDIWKYKIHLLVPLLLFVSAHH